MTVEELAKEMYKFAVVDNKWNLPENKDKNLWEELAKHLISKLEGKVESISERTLNEAEETIGYLMKKASQMDRINREQGNIFYDRVGAIQSLMKPRPVEITLRGEK